MSKKYDAGVKEYRDTYWTPEYVPLDTDLLACFKCTGQEGVPREEVAAAVRAGADACERVGDGLVAAHIIARPHREVEPALGNGEFLGQKD